MLEKIYVWLREPDDGSVSEVDGKVWARSFSNPHKLYSADLRNGYAEIEAPPGNYIVTAVTAPGCCGCCPRAQVVFTGEPVYANLIREYSGDIYSRLPSLVNHAREARIDEKKINEMTQLLVKIGKSVPEEKLIRFSKEELELRREVSDESHLETLKQLEPYIMKK